MGKLNNYVGLIALATLAVVGYMFWTNKKAASGDEAAATGNFVGRLLK